MSIKRPEGDSYEPSREGQNDSPEGTNEFEKNIERGAVKVFFPDPKKQFGFLSTPQGDLFFHANDGREIDTEQTGSPAWSNRQIKRAPSPNDQIIFQRQNWQGRMRAKPWGFVDQYQQVSGQIKEKKEKFRAGLYYAVETEKEYYARQEEINRVPGYLGSYYPYSPTYRLKISEAAGQKPHDGIYGTDAVHGYAAFSKLPFVEGKEKYVEDLESRINGELKRLQEIMAFLSERPFFQEGRSGDAAHAASIIYRGQTLKLDQKYAGFFTGAIRDSRYVMHHYDKGQPVGGLGYDLVTQDSALKYLVENHTGYNEYPLSSQAGIDRFIEAVQQSKREILPRLLQEHVLLAYLKDEPFRLQLQKLSSEMEAELHRFSAITEDDSKYATCYGLDSKGQHCLPVFGHTMSTGNKGLSGKIDRYMPGLNELGELQFRVKMLDKYQTQAIDRKNAELWGRFITPYRKEIARLAGCADLYEEWENTFTPGQPAQHSPEFVKFSTARELVLTKLGKSAASQFLPESDLYVSYGIPKVEADSLREKWQTVEMVFANEEGYNPLSQHPRFADAQTFLAEVTATLEAREKVKNPELQRQMSLIVQDRDCWVVTLNAGKVSAESPHGNYYAGNKLNDSLLIEEVSGTYKIVVLSAKGKPSREFVLRDNASVLIDSKGNVAITVKKLGKSYLAQEELKANLLDKPEVINASLQSTVNNMLKGKYGYNDAVLLVIKDGNLTSVLDPAWKKPVTIEGGQWKQLQLKPKSIIALSSKGNPMHEYPLPQEGMVLVDGKGRAVIVVKEHFDANDNSSLIAVQDLPSQRPGEEPQTVEDLETKKTAGHNPFADFFNKKDKK